MTMPMKRIKWVARTTMATALTAALLMSPGSFPASMVFSTPSTVYAATKVAPVAAPKGPAVLEKFKPLLAKNKDVVGWVTVPNTKIDYPVFKTRNNDYYLHRDINRKKSTPGVVFMDYRDSGNMTDRHTIIYGHHMKDGSMFATLKSYKDEAFYKANPIFSYSTLYGTSQYEIFSVYVAPSKLEIIETNFADDAAFLKFLNTRISKSMYGTTAKVSASDNVLTLITCSYEFTNARLVVHAKKIK